MKWKRIIFGRSGYHNATENTVKRKEKKEVEKEVMKITFR